MTAEIESAEAAAEQARLKWRNDTSGRKSKLFREYVKARMQAISIENYVERNKRYGEN